MDPVNLSQKVSSEVVQTSTEAASAESSQTTLKAIIAVISSILAFVVAGISYFFYRVKLMSMLNNLVVAWEKFIALSVWPPLYPSVSVTTR